MTTAVRKELVPEGAIHERLGIKPMRPVILRALGARLDRFKMGGAVYFKKSQILRLMRAESDAWGGVPALDNLAKFIDELGQP